MIERKLPWSIPLHFWRDHNWQSIFNFNFRFQKMTAHNLAVQMYKMNIKFCPLSFIYIDLTQRLLVQQAKKILLKAVHCFSASLNCWYILFPRNHIWTCHFNSSRPDIFENFTPSPGASKGFTLQEYYLSNFHLCVVNQKKKASLEI